MSKILYYTTSVCPACFKSIPAEVVERNDEIYMRKQCEEHGRFETLLWQDTADRYFKWLEYGGVNTETLPRSLYDLQEDCATDYIKQHSACQQPTAAALMVTNRCNADCPVCFTRDPQEKDHELSVGELKELMTFYRDVAGNGAPIEFCGGEPTVRENLPAIASMAKEMGFDYIQLNTNGIRLSQSAEYCRELSASGITTVYLGFDGISSGPYIYKYNRDLLEIKKRAIANCSQANLAVILVPCIIPGINDHQIGGIIQFAKEHVPTVKGVYFQPISYFGTYSDKNRIRITIPEVLRRIEQQTHGEIKVDNFIPGNYEHPQCSFNGFFLMGNQGQLYGITNFHRKKYDENGYAQIRENTKKTWKANDRKYLTIAGMAFQDAWNVDNRRICRCSIQIIGKNKEMIPLCSKYLTNDQDERYHGGIN